MSVIDINNPTNPLFKPLGNNFKHEIKIDKQYWAAVAPYVYGNLLLCYSQKRTYQIEHHKIKSSDYYNFYKSLENECLINLIRYALHVGYTELILSDEKLIETLIKSRNAKIVFKGHIDILENIERDLVGETLMQIRQEMLARINTNIIQETNTATNDKIYEVYRVYSVLKKLMQEQGNSLKEFSDMPYDKVKERTEKIFVSMPSQNTIIEDYNAYKNKPEKHANVIEEYNRRSLPSYFMDILKNPDSIVLIVQKAFIKDAQHVLNSFQDDMIFDTYVRYIIDGKYPSFQSYVKRKTDKEELEMGFYRRAFNSTFSNLTSKEINALKSNRVFKDIDIDNGTAIDIVKTKILELYNAGIFSDKFQKIMRKKLKKMNLITDEYINEILKADLPTTTDDILESIKITESLSKFKQIIDSMRKNAETETIEDIIEVSDSVNMPFRPNEFIKLITIDKQTFPTVMNYVYTHIAQTMTHDSVYAIMNAYNIKEFDKYSINSFKPLSEVSKTYYSIYNEYLEFKTHALTKIALNMKYRDISMRDLLVMTDDSKLIDSNPQLNFSGDYLMELRDSLKNIGNMVTPDGVSSFGEIIRGNKRLSEIVEKHAKDLCAVVDIASKYMEHLTKKVIGRDLTDFVVLFMTYIYYRENNWISDIVGALMNDKDFTPYPYFQTHYNKICKVLPVTTVRVIYSYAIANIYVLSVLLNTRSPTELANAVLVSSNILSAPQKCDVSLKVDGRVKCALSALVNILDGIKSLSNAYDTDFELNVNDIRLATSILLGTNINVSTSEPDDKESYQALRVALDKLYGNTQDIDKFSKAFYNSLNTINTIQIPSHIKRNRVNFFADI